MFLSFPTGDAEGWPSGLETLEETGKGRGCILPRMVFAFVGVTVTPPQVELPGHPMGQSLGPRCSGSQEFQVPRWLSNPGDLGLWESTRWSPCRSEALTWCARLPWERAAHAKGGTWFGGRLAGPETEGWGKLGTGLREPSGSWEVWSFWTSGHSSIVDWLYNEFIEYCQHFLLR